MIFTACASISLLVQSFEEEEVYYQRLNTSSAILRDSYSIKDSIEARFFVFCAQNEKVDGLGKDKLIINVDDSTFISSLVLAISKSELPIKTSSDYKRVLSNSYCEGSPKVNFLKYAENVLSNDEFKYLYSDYDEPQLFIISAYGAYWDYEYRLEALAGWISTDRLIYRINRGLMAVIFEHDTIAYMDFAYHRDTTFTYHPTELPYEFPQEIMDSLVTLTLKDYKERLK
jgi:hypothetical protein